MAQSDEEKARIRELRLVEQRRIVEAMTKPRPARFVIGRSRTRNEKGDE